MSCKCEGDILGFFLLKADTQANPWIFSGGAQAWTNYECKFLNFTRHICALLSLTGYHLQALIVSQLRVA